ncbi:mitochondrial import protein Pam17-domain-containing protein [Dipodascopsis uninucleata]
MNHHIRVCSARASIPARFLLQRLSTSPSHSSMLQSARRRGFASTVSVAAETTGAPRYDPNDVRSLSWNEFLRLRTYRRYFNLAAAGVTGSIGLVVGWEYVSSIEIDATQTIFGFDPILVLGCGLFGFAGLCSALGPLVGDLAYRFLLLRSRRTAFRLKEDLFLQHVKKNRVDPSLQSFANPAPDYYGEKITSLHGYRKWLRDCAAFRRYGKSDLDMPKRKDFA